MQGRGKVVPHHPDGIAYVYPSDPEWSNGSPAQVWPQPGFYDIVPRTLIVQHRPQGSATVDQDSFGPGAVIIWSGWTPSNPAVLRIRADHNGIVTVNGGEGTKWPDGFVGWIEV